MAEQTAAQKLAQWVTDLRYQDIAPDVIHHARRCVLDTLGVQLRGATLSWIQPVYEYARAMGAGSTTISYHGDRIAAPYSAYANSTFSCSCELQHHGAPESAHPGVTVIPAAQALAEQLGSTGADFITAVIAGYEVQGRVATEMFQPQFAQFYNAKSRHFHPEGLFGVFSAAAAAGKLLNLSVEQLAHAFAIAGSHASTILEYDQSGGEVKRIHSAIAARGGIQAACLAKAGLTGPLTVFEGRHGVFAAFGGSPADASQLFNNIGAPSAVTHCRFRVYPTIGTCHTTLDLVNDLLKEQPIDHRDVESIRVGMRERAVIHVTNIKQPRDVIGAQASLGYSLGVRLVKGSNTLEMYIDPKLWRDPDVLAIAQKLEAYTMNKEGKSRFARLDIKLKDGRVLSGERDYPRGSESLPFSDQVLEDKFRDLAGAVLPKEQCEELIAAINRIDQLSSYAEIIPLMQKR